MMRLSDPNLRDLALGLRDSPFRTDLLEATSVEPATHSIVNINGTDYPRAMWNLILSRRDLGLWRAGIRPHRNWRVTHVKKYFGVKGNTDKVHNYVVVLCGMFDANVEL